MHILSIYSIRNIIIISHSSRTVGLGGREPSQENGAEFCTRDATATTPEMRQGHLEDESNERPLKTNACA